MSDPSFIPRVLIIDDLFGRTLPGSRNRERANLCGQFLLRDITRDEEGRGAPVRIKIPVADAVFFRGQSPVCSHVGDIVENDVAATLKVLESGWAKLSPGMLPWSLVLLDLCFYTGRVTSASESSKGTGMPEGRPSDDTPASYFGLQVLGEIQKRYPDIPVVILSSKPREQVSRQFAFLGALDFLPRSDDDSPERLKELIQLHGMIPDEVGEIVGHSRPLLLALRSARRHAYGRQNILIRGETGVGKELLARYIHHHGSIVSKGPLESINSGALSPQLYASELFGHRQGAFTGASSHRQGRIVQANGGDLFLDEIGNMPLDVQVGILRVLEVREVVPIGASEGIPVDVRFLSATNEDIEAKESIGRFRSDLLFRLREAGTIYLPSLRERREDIPELVAKFLSEAMAANPKARQRDVAPETLKKLMDYDWPGNIREMRNCIRTAVNTYPGVEHLVPAHLALPISSTGRNLTTVAGHSATVAQTTVDTVVDLTALIRLIDQFQLEPTPTALAGKLPELQRAYANLVARLLKAGLLATRRPTPETPEGEILIHPAMKLIAGNSHVSGSAAADMIKKLLKVCPEIREQLVTDPVLKQAYETSCRLRPASPKPRRSER